jgi:hypothetical protein
VKLFSSPLRGDTPASPEHESDVAIKRMPLTIFWPHKLMSIGKSVTGAVSWLRRSSARNYSPKST